MDFCRFLWEIQSKAKWSGLVTWPAEKSTHFKTLNILHQTSVVKDLISFCA